MDKFYEWLASKLPKRLVYFCGLRMIDKVSYGNYRITVNTVLNRWEDDDK